MLTVSPGSRRWRHLGLVAALAVLSGACATSAPPEPSPPPAPAAPAEEERPYLVSPLQGWGEPVPAEAAALLEEGFSAIGAGDPDGARVVLDSLAREVPEVDTGTYPPASVLAAQADLLDGRAAAAQARLEPLAEGYTEYTPLQLALGRAASLTGDLVSSYAAFRRVAAVSDLAFERASEMAPRVTEILARRVGDALQRAEAGPERAADARLEEAGEALDLLDRWFPDAPPTLTLSVAVAEARGDRQAELEALRRLVPRAEEIAAEIGPEIGSVPGVGVSEPRRLVERQAELELEVGDSRAGLDLFSDLVEQYPDDPRLAERMAFAKFRWRVDQMPPRVATAASMLTLERGDLAVLLYWLVPRVRSASGGQARIASDILDDPRREEMARILNLELMDMDTAVYRFYPEREALRADALEAVLRVLRRFGGATCTPPPLPAAGSEAVAGGDEAQSVAATPAPRVCRAAVECGLIDPDEPCRPGEPVSGGEAVDLLRRALAWMAGSDER